MAETKEMSTAHCTQWPKENAYLLSLRISSPFIPSSSSFLNKKGMKRVSMGLTDRRKTAKNLVDSRKNWKILTVSRKQGKKELTVKETVPYIC